MSEIRLQKFLSDNGIASRRKCEEYILQGKVKVNDKIITELGTKINTEHDKVFFNNKLVKLVNNKVYILLNKPEGYVTTACDEYNRSTVFDLINLPNVRLVSVRKTRYVYVRSTDFNQ